MALQLRATYQSLNDEPYVVEIYNDKYSDIVGVFELGSIDAVIFENDGSSRDIFKRLIATKISFTIIVNNQAVLDYIDSINTANETDHVVKVYRNGKQIFRGYAVFQAHKLQDDIKNRIYKYVAACGIGRLRDINLDFFEIYGSTVPELVSLFDVLRCAMSQAKILDLYDLGGGNYDYFMRMRMIHVEDNVVGQFDHPLKLYYVSNKAFKDNDRKYVTAYTAIEYIMEVFNCRLHYRDDQFVMEHLWAAKYQGGSYWEIKEDGSNTFNPQNYDAVVDYEVNNIKPASGNTISLLPAPKVINLKFEGAGRNNVAEDVRFYRNATNDNIDVWYNLGYVFDGDVIFKAAFVFLRDKDVPFNYNFVQPLLNYVRYTIQIRIGNYYLNGSVLSQNFQLLTVDDSVLIDAATNTLLMPVNPTDRQTVSIGSDVYTFRSVYENTDRVVIIGSGAAVTAQRLRKAINLSGEAGVDYAEAMTPNETVTAEGLTGSPTIHVTAIVAGREGNDIACATTVTGASWDTATLEGGTPFWTTVESNFYIWSDGYYGVYDVIEMVEYLPEVPTDGVIEIRMREAEFIELSTLNVLETINFDTHTFVLLANQQADESEVEYNKIIELNNTEILKLTMHIGDVADFYAAEQRLFYSPSFNNFLETSVWNGSGRNIQEVIMNEVEDMRGGTLWIYSGKFYDFDPSLNSMHHTSRLIHRNRAFNFLRTKHVTGRDEISGTWFEIRNAVIDTTPPPALPNYPVVAPDEQILRNINDPILPVNKNTVAFQGGKVTQSEIAKLDQALSSGDVITTFSINPITNKLYAGDQVELYDINSGNRDTFTISQDVNIGDTEINIESYTLQHDWTRYSVLALSPKFVASQAFTLNNLLTLVFEDVTENYIDIPSTIPLPDPANYTESEYRALVKIKANFLIYYKSGTKTKLAHFSVDVSGSNNRINFFRKLKGTDIIVEILKV